MGKRQKLSKWEYGLTKKKLPKMSKIGTPMMLETNKAFAGGRASVRKMDLGGIGNGSKHGAFFNGKADKEKRPSKKKRKSGVGL